MEPDYVRLKEIKPALSGYIRESQAFLKKSVQPDEKVVHDVRVLMKKSRATLKLASPQLEKSSFEKDISALKEVGRLMGIWRDTSVHRRTLKELKKEYPQTFSRLAENEKITILLRKTEPAHELSVETKNKLEQILDILNRTAYRIRFQSMNKLDPQLLMRELNATYSLVVDLYLTCRNDPKPDNIHEFRKRTKDLLYQVWFFRPLNLPVVKSMEKKLDSIAQNLGKFNDLTQLIKTIGYNYKDKSNLPALDQLVIKIRDKQDRYLARVWPVAFKIFGPGKDLVNILGFRVLIL